MFGVARMKHLAAHGILMNNETLSFPSIKVTCRFSLRGRGMRKGFLIYEEMQKYLTTV
jgi:hypothetical protein